ncbi:MAG: Xaa-Pro peptidase family protein [Sulfitobacter sp.]|nr:Xaa-Pro peptidase family protein [Sulfitobacter sp.]
MTGRGFPLTEYKARLARAQALMSEAEIAALLLTTEPEVRYFTGYLTRFWESPTRPWFLLVPASGDPVAVIPSIGAALMGATWIRDIRTWSAPDLEDDGIGLLADTLADLVPKSGRIAVPDGHETHLRMPLADLERLKQRLGGRTFCGDAGILRRLRMVKSPAEVAKIEASCTIAAAAFAKVPDFAGSGVPLDQVFRQFQMACLAEGADWVPYLAGGAGQGGYRDVISPAGERPLERGDVLMLDTGLVRDGYFCDFDRNWSLGVPDRHVADAHARLIEASDAAFEIARPGITAADLFHTMNDILAGGAEGTDAGRLGHGLGMSLTEWPSLIAGDHTVIEAGMVLTLEPGISVGEGIMVHEEDIVITETGARYLSPRLGAGMEIL